MGKNIMEAMVLHSVEACIEHLKSINTEDKDGLDMRWPLQVGRRRRGRGSREEGAGFKGGGLKIADLLLVTSL